MRARVPRAYWLHEPRAASQATFLIAYSPKSYPSFGGSEQSGLWIVSKAEIQKSFPFAETVNNFSFPLIKRASKC